MEEPNGHQKTASMVTHGGVAGGRSLGWRQADVEQGDTQDMMGHGGTGGSGDRVGDPKTADEGGA